MVYKNRILGYYQKMSTQVVWPDCHAGVPIYGLSFVPVFQSDEAGIHLKIY